MAVFRERRSIATSIKVGERKPVQTVPTKALIRSMQQTPKNSALNALYYEFHFGISTFTHDSSGVLYTEIPRPLNMPLVDATSQKLERCSFEFLIAVPYDSLGSSIDSHITLLQDFANENRSVRFFNVHSALSSRDWNIDSITFQITRVNESGKATAVTCNISLVEAVSRIGERFLQLPKFSYAIPKGVGLSDKSGVDGDKPDQDSGPTAGIQKIQGLGNGKVQITAFNNHNLPNGTKVQIVLSPGLSSSVRSLTHPGAVYEITFSSSTPTKFTYTKVGAGVVAETTLLANQGEYVVVKATDKQEVYVPAVNVDLKYTPFAKSTTTQKQDNIIVLDGDVLALNTLRETIIKPYLYSLQTGKYTKELYAKNIGDTSSASFQAAVTYLVKMHEQGRLPQNIGLPEIILNANL